MTRPLVEPSARRMLEKQARILREEEIDSLFEDGALNRLHSGDAMPSGWWIIPSVLLGAIGWYAIYLIVQMIAQALGLVGGGHV